LSGAEITKEIDTAMASGTRYSGNTPAATIRPNSE
jgi:hypothetical protein